MLNPQFVPSRRLKQLHDKNDGLITLVLDISILIELIASRPPSVVTYSLITFLKSIESVIRLDTSNLAARSRNLLGPCRRRLCESAHAHDHCFCLRLRVIRTRGYFYYVAVCISAVSFCEFVS